MEKLTNNEQARKWSDHIPLQYKYTAGVAGERFLQLLKQEKILGSVCKQCNKMFVPPKIFCKDCFVQLSEWREVQPNSSYIYSFTVLNNSGVKETVVLVKFDGAEGGLLGRFKAGKEEPRIGMRVKPVFKPKEERRGELEDILHFEKYNF
ncbi:MAG: Zn-ribbon domain-containing OB-fold protein [Nitrososphaerota archaeon]|nr:Zn-ribbon domain-containing OB-fold protein [Nitrososphaerota archaeon]